MKAVSSELFSLEAWRDTIRIRRRHAFLRRFRAMPDQELIQLFQSKESKPEDAQAAKDEFIRRRSCIPDLFGEETELQTARLNRWAAREERQREKGRKLIAEREASMKNALSTGQMALAIAGTVAFFGLLLGISSYLVEGSWGPFVGTVRQIALFFGEVGLRMVGVIVTTIVVVWMFTSLLGSGKK